MDLLDKIRYKIDGHTGFARFLYMTGLGAILIAFVCFILMILIFIINPLVTISIIAIAVIIFISYLVGVAFMGET